MKQLTAAEARAILEANVAQAEETLDLAQSLARSNPGNLRAGQHIRKARRSLETRQAHLASHKEQFPDAD
ncbi:hypothetical protein FV232_22300 [Methylobacterium sp. WL30]|uniref:hypothetical protein n=1 Tax=unclassified Methylobacterium TaxID=2615210 RepID=UPI0011C9D042|nr:MULTISPECIES: hypothetical protein [unclassified Methylobacterium]TXM93933.1 hypothetical protein FV223_06580 [Methylobacterium sp. WL116]TXN41401.1 hypothetical protein FV225_02625 [Methylobacterium sp. WL93]TXN49783.1 hypothetical protein FV227_14915 [Methylobacterium sp. WL119]TXN63829.1 hypothetical protein FV232_22300 [Methylobacterium sp. WL30]